MLWVWAILLAPFAFGFLGLWRMEHFRREAFGHLRSLTLFMMVAVLLGLSYYAFVLVAVQHMGWVQAMALWPLSPMAALMYLQSAFATGALLAFVAAGDRAWRVTVPRPPGAPAPKP